MGGKKVLLSGIQPSGNLMIGNYIGAIKNWVDLQDQYDCLFMLVDLHALTVKQDPEDLRRRCYEFVAQYIACGIDPEENTIFIQSHVPGHSQLAWILNCYTQMGELNRMTQFKDKSKRHAENINVGLFDYPVLMAADILLYGTDLVPVGDDQKQHLELTRDIAQRFNGRFGEILRVPDPFIPKVGARIMSLQDPTAKMSKSDENVNSYIALTDPEKTILKKVKRATTDSGSAVVFGDGKGGVANLLTIYSTITGEPIEEIEQAYAGKGYGHFKVALAERVIEFLRPVQEKFHAVMEDRSGLEKILQQGAERAQARSEEMLKKVSDVIGLIGRT